MMGTIFLVVCLMLPLGGTAFAYGDGGGSGDVDQTVSTGGTGVVPGYEEEFIDPEFRTPDFVYPKEEKENTIENTWGKHVKKKPAHWTEKQWRDYKRKRQRIFEHQQKQSFGEKKSADRKLTIAKGTGVAASAAGAVIGAVAAPAVAPTIVIISVTGDGLAATAGSLADGKSAKESLKDGLKKAGTSAILSKMGNAVGGGKTGAALEFVGGQAYDNASPSTSGPINHHMPPPDFVTPGGHEIRR